MSSGVDSAADGAADIAWAARDFFILESFSKVQRAGEGREHARSKSNLSTCDKAQLEVVAAAAAAVVNVIGEVACSVGEREREHMRVEVLSRKCSNKTNLPIRTVEANTLGPLK